MPDPFSVTPATLLPAAEAAPDAFIPGGQTVGFGRGMAWITDAFGLFMRAPGPWVLFVLVLFVAMVAMSMVPLVGQLAFNLLLPLLLAGVITVCRNLERGEPLRSEDFLTGFSDNPAPLLVVGGLYLAGSLVILAVFFFIVIATLGTAILAGMSDPNRLAEVATLGTLFMLAVASLVALALYVPLMMVFWFATPLVHFHHIAPVDAMKASFSGCLRNILPFLLYGVVSFLLLIISVIPLGLGLLVTIPIFMITGYTSYKDIYLKR